VSAKPRWRGTSAQLEELGDDRTDGELTANAAAISYAQRFVQKSCSRASGDCPTSGGITNIKGSIVAENLRPLTH
jgi:hypothetical protein